MEFFEAAWLGKPLWMWGGFLALVMALLAFDLGVLHRQDREIGIAESLWLSAFYIGFAMPFGAGIWWWLGTPAADHHRRHPCRRRLSSPASSSRRRCRSTTSSSSA